jgi:CheY-like chemotaxis protein
MGMLSNGMTIPAVSRKYHACKPHNSTAHSTYGETAFLEGGLAQDYVRGEQAVYFSDIEGVKSFHILLIAGVSSEREYLRSVISKNLNFSIEYLEADSGNVAIRLLGNELVDMVVFGDNVADMDGLEFLDYLKRKHPNNKIPVIEILNPCAEGLGIQVMKMGAHDYLLKDCDGHYFELLPILVSRIHSELKAMGVLNQANGIQENITDNIPAVVYQISLQGGVHDVRISSQLAELGVSAHDWGSDLELHHRLCYSEDKDVVLAALEDSYRNGSIFRSEYRINVTGGQRWVSDSAKVVMDKFNRPLFVQGVMTDISNIKTLEAELSHYRTMLDKMVRAKTESLIRRISILESCNASLGDNYHLMHKMYLDLLMESQSKEIESSNMEAIAVRSE